MTGVVYSFFGLLEHMSDVILFWVPFYYSFKLGFLIWMMLPGQKGATFIYQAVRSRVIAADLPKSTTRAAPGGSTSEEVYNDAD